MAGTAAKGGSAARRRGRVGRYREPPSHGGNRRVCRRPFAPSLLPAQEPEGVGAPRVRREQVLS
ncbi:MAG TPA: hypothetical protein DEA73_06850 [Peptococcaceae bacterium]|nr:hypothetical protein [Peptococcaceae bacterium]